MRRRKSHPGLLPFLIACLFLVSFLAFFVTRIVISIQYDRAVEGHLKRAADANQVALAMSELEAALDGMDRRGITCESKGEQEINRCFTSVLYTTPDEDVGFWRSNIEQTLEDLRAVPADADHLTVSNTLMKVRETLLDAGKSGDHVTDPSGVGIYGSNVGFAIWGWGNLIGLFLFGFLWVREN